jgi:hypothetical protein
MEEGLEEAVNYAWLNRHQLYKTEQVSLFTKLQTQCGQFRFFCGRYFRNEAEVKDMARFFSYCFILRPFGARKTPALDKHVAEHAPNLKVESCVMPEHPYVGETPKPKELKERQQADDTVQQIVSRIVKLVQENPNSGVFVCDTQDGKGHARMVGNMIWFMLNNASFATPPLPECESEK